MVKEIRVNATKIEFEDEELGATRTLKQLSDGTYVTNIATGAEVTTGTNNTKIVTPKSIGDATALTTKTYNGLRITSVRDMTIVGTGGIGTISIPNNTYPSANIFIGGLVNAVGTVAGQYMGQMGDVMITLHAITNVAVTWVTATGIVTITNNTGQTFYGTILAFS